MRCRLLLLLVLLPTLAQPAEAGILFGRKARKPNPKERVPELLALVKTDRDENKRARAAEELRQHDPAAFPEILPTLVEVLQNDAKPSVRAEAAQSIGKLRPISQQAGMALEQALSTDSSMRVRIQDRSALLGYHWAGYRNNGKKAEPPPLTTKEPPLADNGSYPPPISTRVSPYQVPLRPQPVPAYTPVPSGPPTSRPLPAGPVLAPPPVPATQEPPLASPPAASPAPASPPPASPPAEAPTAPPPSTGPSLEGPALE